MLLTYVFAFIHLASAWWGIRANVIQQTSQAGPAEEMLILGSAFATVLAADCILVRLLFPVRGSLKPVDKRRYA